MPWLFVIPLVIAAIVVYIATNSSDEIAYLATSILLVSLILSLIFAPWEIQGALLLLVLLSNKRFLPSVNSIEKSLEDNQKVDKQEMTNLSYRGVNYKESTPPPVVEVSECEIVGKYRGQVWKKPEIKNAIDLQPAGVLKYRGAICTPKEEAIAPLAQKTPVLHR